MWLPVISLFLGFAALVWSADRFLAGAAATARILGMPPIMIGMTVVSLGTSAPEIMVAIAAALRGTPVLAVGNAVGSNIANIGLVLGITAVLAPLPFSRNVLRSELPWLMGATLLAILCLADLHMGRVDGTLLLLGLGLVIYKLVRDPGAEDSSELLEELEELPALTPRAALLWLATGLVVLLASAEVLVWAASKVALGLGVSELVVGLTIVAIGTSLPELAATVGSALKGHTDIAIGNVVGSNILNILAVLAVPGLLAPTILDPEVLWRDSAMMLALTLLLLLFAYGINSRPVITRFEGVVITLCWVGYMVLVFWKT
jgi:cation:H+ antiporter